MESTGGAGHSANRTLIKNCTLTEGCLGADGHRGDCVFADGTQVMEQAETKLTVTTRGDLASLGILVLSPKAYERLSIFKKAGTAIITVDGDTVTVVKSKHVQCPDKTIEGIATAVRMVGGVVRFNVGEIIIEGPGA